MKSNEKEKKYEIWLSIRNTDHRIQLPVNPSEISISCKSKNTTVDINGLGEVTILQESALKEFQFSSFLPSQYGPYCDSTDIVEPWDIVNFIEKYRYISPLGFVITDTPVNYAVTVEDFKVKEKSGDVGTLYYDITLREFKMVKPREINNSFKDTSNKQRPNEKVIESKFYTVKKGDCLWRIARDMNVKDWRDIAKLNNIKEPYIIHPNEELKLP